MNELHSILVTYDDSKNDRPTIICGKYRHDGEAKILAAYVGDNAQELYKIVSEPGYLNEHDSKIIEEEHRRIYEEYKKAVKADSDAYIHGYMFPKNVERFWQQMKGESS